MSESTESNNNAIAASAVVAGPADNSSTSNEPIIRGRRTIRGDHNYVDTDEEQENPSLQRRSVDILPWGEEEDSAASADTHLNDDEQAVENIANEAAPIVDEGPTAQNEEQPHATNADGSAENTSNDDNVINLDSPSPPKKRKRLSTGTPVAKQGSNADDDDEDDGMTCPICLDSWEMSGEHRLVSLRCGHLFGEICIRRWLTESMRQSSVRVCPQCKTKARNADIRYLYAKRLRAIDRTEEHRMRDELEAERRRVQSLTTELATVKMAHTYTCTKLHSVESDNARLRQLVRVGCSRNAFDDNGKALNSNQMPSYRLYMEKNFEITKDTGCRVMLYSSKHSNLVASQKSTNNLFPGYGLRFIDTPTFKPLHFMHTSAQLIRDISFNADESMLAVASRETRVKLFDVRTRLCSSSFTANDKILWSCGMDRNEREHFLYVGDLRGNTYIYDVRFPDNIVSEFLAQDSFSPVIHVSPVPAGKLFSSGGFLVCQLTSLTFYEYINETAEPTRLNVEGPFLAMQYDVIHDTLLISARSNAVHAQSRFILAKLEKIDGTPVLNVKATIFGSKATPIMTRPTQLSVVHNTLVVGYLQDSKQLIVHDTGREERVQTLPVNEVVYDICPVSTRNDSYLAALTDNKCRIYKLSQTNN